MSTTEGSLMAAVDTVLDASSARELTRQIKVGLEHSYTLIIAAYRGQAWGSMGYSSWDAYCQGEFGNLALQPPHEERQSVIMSMREAGMSIRAISAATVLGRGTVAREIESTDRGSSDVPNGTPAAESGRVLGSDGKSYQAVQPRPHHPPSSSSHTDAPLSEELLDLPTAEIGIQSLDLATRRRSKGSRSALAKRLSGSMDAPLPMMIRIAGELTEGSGIKLEAPEDAETFSELAADASRGILTLSHVLASIDASVFRNSADDSVEVSGVITDAVEVLGRFLDGIHQR